MLCMLMQYRRAGVQFPNKAIDIRSDLERILAFIDHQNAMSTCFNCLLGKSVGTELLQAQSRIGLHWKTATLAH